MGKASKGDILGISCKNLLFFLLLLHQSIFISRGRVARVPLGLWALPWLSASEKGEAPGECARGGRPIGRGAAPSTIA